MTSIINIPLKNKNKKFLMNDYKNNKYEPEKDII